MARCLLLSLLDGDDFKNDEQANIVWSKQEDENEGPSTVNTRGSPRRDDKPINTDFQSIV
jgi:hypothetical protein